MHKHNKKRRTPLRPVSSLWNRSWYKGLAMAVFLGQAVGLNAFPEEKGSPCGTEINKAELSAIGSLALLDSVLCKLGQNTSDAFCYDSLYRQLHFGVKEYRYNYLKKLTIHYLFKGDYEEARKMLDAYRAEVMESGSALTTGGYYLTEGNYYVYSDNLAEAASSYRKAAEIFRQNGLNRRLFLTYGNLSTVYLNAGKYEAAYQYLLMAQNMQQAHKVASGKEMSISLNNIGVTYFRRGLYGQADSLFKVVEQMSDTLKEGAYPRLLSRVNQMELAVRQEYWKEASVLEQKILSDLPGFMSLFHWYARWATDIYLQQKDYKGVQELIKRLETYEDQQAEKHSLSLMLMKIKHALALNKPNEALRYIRQAGVLENLNTENEIELSRYRQQAFLLRGQNLLALEEAEHLKQLDFRLQSERQQLRMEEMAAIYELETFKSARDRAEERAALLERNRLYLAIALLLALSGVIILGFLFRSNRHRAREERARAEAARQHSLQLDKQLQVQRHNALHSGIGAAQLKNNIMSLVDRYESNVNMLRRRLNILLNEYSAQGDFVELFLLSYPDFFKTLSKEMPDITRSQLRYAILIALGASTTEIASIQGVSQSAVKMARYRLKSKIGLEEDNALDHYLRHLLLK